jgi:predicted ribosome quality control (RQC) complex YloA/Tae2 family protein
LVQPTSCLQVAQAAAVFNMKQRFSSLDVRVISHELSKSLVSLRIANIYDLSSRIFLFKCAKPGARQQLLVDSGFRCHLTAFTRAAAAAPSAFVSRLRKYLKSRRITSVTQIGTDRVIEIAFSDGQYRLFLEFFAAGNLILTDKDYTVLALLRQVSEGDEDVDVKLGSIYVLKAKQNFDGIPPLTQERVKETLSAQIQKASDAAAAGGKKGKRYKGGQDLRKALSAGFPEYPAHLLDHAFKSTDFDALLKPDAVLQDGALFAKLMKALEFANKVFQSLDALDQAKGYIIAKGKEPTSDSALDATAPAPTREQVLYDDFHPFRPSQFEGKQDIYILEFDGFNKTVDEFYSSIESQKLESKLTEREEAAKRKLENARQDHEKRVGALQQVQEIHIRKAQAIEANTHRVEEAIAAVNGLIAQGMDWMDIGKLIENEQSRSNAVAQMIKLPLKLYENTVMLLLDEATPGDESDEENDITDDEDMSDEDDEKPFTKQKTVADKRLAVDIDLALSPWANARQYYDQKKSAAVKEQKTIQASTRALKSTEMKIESDLKKVLKQEKQSLRPARKAFWFEKFVYFISSDGYLVLGGKDAQQNELLYRRYLKKGDVYVHADLQGAASVIVKNMIATPDAPIPPTTLSQAGALSVCTSSAWDSKAVMAAWWVNSDQVSKTTPTGEYLTTGGFMIRGKKNFLPPSQLLLGFAVMFQISEGSKVHHNKHRLQHTDSLTSEDVRNLADDAQDLSLLDEQGLDGPAAEDGDAVPDAEEAAKDVRAGVAAVTKTANVGDEDDAAEENAGSDIDGEDTDHEDEDGSESDGEKVAINPLQTASHPETKSAANQDDSVDEGYSSLDNPDHEDETPQTDSVADPENQDANPQSKPDSKPPQRPMKQKQAPVPRGKRTKAKKAAKKYADQDEEDRALAMQLLGSAKAAEKKEAATMDKAAHDAKIAADKERRRAQHERAAQAERIRQEKLAVGEGLDNSLEQDEEVAEQERRELANLDAFVGTPMPGDEIIAALPVVAPWSALGKCKYKTKLQPGSVKKGKAVREIVTRWTEAGKLGPKVVDESQTDRERIWPREIECIRAWRVEEVIGLLPVGKVRIVQGGGQGGGGSVGGGGGKGKGGNAGRGGRASKKGR